MTHTPLAPRKLRENETAGTAQPAEAGAHRVRYACTNASRSAFSTSALTVSIPCE